MGRADKGTFIVCDDAPLICSVIKNLLEKEGYLCVGLAENGLELLKEVKEKNASTKVIIVTADSTEEASRTAISYGADAFVTKPFLPQHIMTALENIFSIKLSDQPSII